MLDIKDLLVKLIGVNDLTANEFVQLLPDDLCSSYAAVVLH